MSPARRGRHSALLTALLLAGCATGGGKDRSPANALPAVVLASPPGCCTAQPFVGLRDALERRATLQRIQTHAQRAPSPQDDAQQRKQVEATLAKAQQQYLTMRVDAARRELQQLLRRVKRDHGRHITPAQLARAHLLLGALAHALRRESQLRRHAVLAVAYDPKLQPDADIYSPPVREAVERARLERATLEVEVTSQPPGAQVTWDGVPRGEAPAHIPDQAKGQHYLLVEHPLAAPWGEVIQLATTAKLEVKLKPAPPDQLAAAVARQTELGPAAVQLLGVNALLWAEPTDQGLRLVLATRERSRELLLSTPITPSTRLESLAVAATRRAPAANSGAPAVGPGASPASDPTSATSDRQPLAGPTSIPAASPTQPPGSGRSDRPSHWRRDWWAYALTGAVVVAAAVVLPLTLMDQPPERRGMRLELP